MTRLSVASEANLAVLLEDGLRRARIPFYHTHDSRRSAEGFPDYVIRTSPLIFAELKRDGGLLAPAQADWLAGVATGGSADAFVVVGTDGVLQLLRYAIRRATQDRRPGGPAVVVLGSGKVRLSGETSAAFVSAVDLRPRAAGGPAGGTDRPASPSDSSTRGTRPAPRG